MQVSFWSELSRRDVYKVGAAYVLTAWIVAQVISIVNEPFGFPDGFDTVAFILLAIGFPVTLILAWVYELRRDGIKRTASLQQRDPARRRSNPRMNYVLIGLAGGAVLGSGASWLIGNDADEEWLETEALPEIEALMDSGEWEAGFALAQQAEERVPGDPDLAELRERLSWSATITTEPAGATVYRRPYDDTEASWQEVGVTPIEGEPIPNGVSMLRVELDGYETVYRAVGGISVAPRLLNTPMPIRLDRSGTSVGMIRVAGIEDQETNEARQAAFGDFLLGRYEVTNAEYKVFMVAGGYQQADLWPSPIVVDGETLSLAEARDRLFRDRTGRLGPATWSVGNYTDGEDDFPVGGISWYEAMAYARFADAELPTVHHWRRAYWSWNLSYLLPVSNFSSDGPVAVGSTSALSWSGAYDMAGNVREWVANPIGDQRLALGGGWDSDAFEGWTAANKFAPVDPWDRSDANGLRIARSDDEPAVRELLAQPVRDTALSWDPDFEPVSDAVFESFLSHYEYDAAPLDAELLGATETRHWRRERIAIDAAYGNARFDVYLYLPSERAGPYQTIVHWPGSAALSYGSIDEYPTLVFEPYVKNGRAVAFPMLNHTFDRQDGTPYPDPNSIAALTAFSEWVKDVRRTIDYLETRNDIDADRIAYHGYSWGSIGGAKVLAVEPRIRVAVLALAGLASTDQGFVPEVDSRNFLPRISQPVLVLSGRYDNNFPLEASAIPYYRMIGTPEPDKRQEILDSGHYLPQDRAIGHSLDWLDRYLGPPTP